MSDDTYMIIEEGTTIQCLVCEMTSYSLEDVARKWCGLCKSYHNTPMMKAALAAKQGG